MEKGNDGGGKARVCGNWLCCLAGNLANPERGCLKANTDIANFEEAGLTGMACVVRDHCGEVKGLFYKAVQLIKEPKFAELFCIREVLTWIKKFYQGSLGLKSNSLSAISDINGFVSNASYMGNLISDCILFKDLFSNLSFKFFRRLANVVAHTLARAT